MKLGFTFKDGMLHLATPQGEMRLQWAPKPLAEKRLLNGRWEAFIPEFRMLAPPAPLQDTPSEILRTKQAAFQAFRAGLPADLAAAVEPFSSHQWALLVLAHDSSSGPDLLRHNPVLAYALANNGYLEKHPTASTPFKAIRYSHRKQREILDWLGFPASEAMARIFRKIPPGIVHPGVLRKLREATRNPEAVKVFSHLDSITTGVIYLMSYPEMALLASPRLVQEVAASAEEYDAAPTADALQEIVLNAKDAGRVADLGPFTSRRKVWERHEQLMQDRRRWEEERRAAEEQAEQDRRNNEARAQAERDRRARQRQERQRIPFPPPPIPGTSGIIPLTSLQALVEEGHRQHNCVGTNRVYEEKVRKGQCYIYHVDAPQPHTLCIGRRGWNIWVIEELKGIRNVACTIEAHVIVQCWLNCHQVSL